MRNDHLLGVSEWVFIEREEFPACIEICKNEIRHKQLSPVQQSKRSNVLFIFFLLRCFARPRELGKWSRGKYVSCQPPSSDQFSFWNTFLFQKDNNHFLKNVCCLFFKVRIRTSFSHFVYNRLRPRPGPRSPTQIKNKAKKNKKMAKK